MTIQAISSFSSTSSSATTLALANKVTSSSKTGKTGGGGGGGKVQSSSSSSDDSSTYDKMDLNKDGTVSASEKALYMMMHPNDAETEDSTQNYTNQGKQDEYAGGFSGVLNLSA